jgi:hypothetical protein
MTLVCKLAHKQKKMPVIDAVKIRSSQRGDGNGLSPLVASWALSGLRSTL